MPCFNAKRQNPKFGGNTSADLGRSQDMKSGSGSWNLTAIYSGHHFGHAVCWHVWEKGGEQNRKDFEQKNRTTNWWQTHWNFGVDREYTTCITYIILYHDSLNDTRNIHKQTIQVLDDSISVKNFNLCRGARCSLRWSVMICSGRPPGCNATERPLLSSLNRTEKCGMWKVWLRSYAWFESGWNWGSVVKTVWNMGKPCETWQLKLHNFCVWPAVDLTDCAWRKGKQLVGHVLSYWPRIDQCQVLSCRINTPNPAQHRTAI